MVSRLTQKTLKALFALSGNYCAYPGCQLPVVDASGNVVADICHIKARSPGGPRFDPTQTDAERHRIDNLVLMCANHHRLIDDHPEQYPVAVLQGMKQTHEVAFGRGVGKGDEVIAKRLLEADRRVYVTSNTGNIAIGSPGAILAQHLTIKAPRGKLSVTPPPGTIGADQNAARYTEYLIKRYNEFAASEPARKGKFSYGALSRNIESQFGAKWQLLPIEMASRVYAYLQQRISRTRIACVNRGNGHAAFSTYDEFLAKHGFNPSEVS